MDETVQEEIAAKYSEELERARELMDLTFSRGSASTDAAEDRVVFPLLVSCRDIIEEILFAIRDGFGRAALRATRTMCECLVIARHLNLHPEKTEDFLNLFYIEWAKVYQDIPEVERDAGMEAEIRAHVPRYAQGKRVRTTELEWSGNHVYELAKEAGSLAELHSLVFTLASAYIHPGAVLYLSSLSTSEQEESVVKISEKTQDAEARHALRGAHDLLLNAVDLRLKYAPSSAIDDLFCQCKDDFLRIWGYQPHI